MKEIDMIKVESTQIASVGYDKPLYDLYVEFNNGKVYRYDDVPEWTYNAFARSESPGKFFHGEIKNNFDYELVDVDIRECKIMVEEY